MLQVLNISKSFNGRKVLDQINMTLFPGQVTFLLGPSGAGKTTLLNILGGLEFPDSGSIQYCGIDIQENLDLYRSRQIGFIFQDYNLIPGMSVTENVELGLLYGGKSCSGTTEALQKIGLADTDQRASTLSGGEKQRVAVARSALKGCNILLADEPTGNLDSQHAKEVMDLLKRNRTGRVILIVTHNKELAAEYADRIIEMQDGRIISDTVSSSNDRSAAEDSLRHQINWLSESEEKIENRRKIKQARRLLAKNSFRERKWKILPTATAIAVTICAIYYALLFFASGKEIIKNTNTYYLESDLIQLFYPTMQNSGYGQYPFDSETVQQVEKTYEYTELIPVYLPESLSWTLSNTHTAVAADIKQAAWDEFFEKRIGSYDIIGRFPEDDFEMILAEDVAEKLYGGNCLEKKIQLNDGEGHNVQMTVAAINKTVNPFDSIYSFISYKAIKTLQQEVINESCNKRLEVLVWNDGSAPSIHSGDFYAKPVDYSDDVNIICGVPIENDHDILISTRVLREFFGKDRTSDLSDIFNKRFYININGVHETHICGVYESNEIEFMILPEFKKTLSEIAPVRLDMYLDTASNALAVKESVNKTEAFIAYASMEQLKTKIDGETYMLRLTFVFLSAFFLFLSVILVSFFSTIMVKERSKEIAIVRCLGSSDRDIMKILQADSYIMILIAVTAALIMTVALMLLIPYFEPHAEVLFQKPSVLLFFSIAAAFSAAITLVTNAIYRKLAAKSPSELLRE